jgi:hypothetical protein
MHEPHGRRAAERILSRLEINVNRNNSEFGNLAPIFRGKKNEFPEDLNAELKIQPGSQKTQSEVSLQ